MGARGAMIVALSGVGVVAVLGALPGTWPLALVGVGLVTFTLGCAGMLYQLREEAPDHPILGPPRIRVGPAHWDLHVRVWFGRRPINPIRLIHVHWERHGMDLWSTMVTVGITIVVIVAVVRWLI